MSELANNIEVQTINHLGIIAGIIDEIGIVEIINKQLGVHSQEKLSCGIIVKSIILNALGFVSRPLYLFPQFFSDKAKFAKLISNFKKQVNLDSIFVADSSLYSQENIFLIQNLKWITRVPLSIKAAQFLVKQTSDSEFSEIDREGYKAVEKAHRPR